ncbi:hypothetical protein lerEdw1_014989 [Lerista edwardsae]|nr:hypothetical protein lerEdw1_014989 [Lerista edwardsae]
MAQDQGDPSLSASSSLVIPISDVNDNAPTFAQHSYTVFVKENNPPGAHIFTVSASDPDMAENGLISYWLDEKLWPLSSYISVHSESGKLYALQPLDYEELKLLEFQVSAKDAGLPSLYGNVTVQVFVVDENDNAPAISAPAEDAPILLVVPVAAGHMVGKVRALDADSGYNAWLRYELHEGSSGPWRVGLHSGEISTTHALDEAEVIGTSKTLLVLVKDHGKPALSATATLSVSLVSGVQAVQADAHLPRTGGGPKPLVENVNVYLIIAICSVSSLFLLVIIVYVALRCQCQAKEEMMYGPGTATLVCASEVGSWSYSNRHSHILGGVSGEAGAKSDLMVFSPNIPVFAVNGEVGSATELVPNSSAEVVFSKANSCQYIGMSCIQVHFKNYYSLKVAEPLDREQVAEFRLVVTAQDQGAPSLSATSSLVVPIGDVNDNAPTFSQPSYTVFIKENNPPGAHIFTVSASDPDVAENSLVSYWLDEKLWQLSSYISVHSESGKVYALQPLDYEELKLLEFQVNAKDAGLPSLTGNVTVQVFVIDENDNAPAVSDLAKEPPVLLVLPVKAGQVVGKIRALDADSGYNAWLRYELHEATTGPWRVGLYSGEISTTRVVDEMDGSGSSQNLLLLVKDHGKPMLSATATLSVSLVTSAQVTNTDAHLPRTGGSPKPLVDNVNVYLIIAICSVSSLFLLVIIIYMALRCQSQAKEAMMYGPGTATLVCASEVGSWSYSNRHSHILAGVSGEAGIKSDLIAFSPNIPPPPGSERPEHCDASVQLHRPQTSSLVVPIGDVNDNAPTFAQHSYTVFVKENNPPGAHIFTVSASDPDMAENGLISYWLDEKLWPLSSYISVHSESGKLYALQPLDYEELKLLEFQVSAKDAGLPSLYGNVTVQVFVVDENDNVPAVSAPAEDAPILLVVPVAAGHMLGKVRALDADSGYNAWLRYELHEGSSGPWRVGLHSGEISTTHALDEAEVIGTSKTLLVLVKDHGKPALSATATLSVSLVSGVQAVQADAHLPRTGGGPKPLVENVNVYLIIAICSVSSLFRLVIIVYVALQCQCQAKEEMMYGPGTATLVCASEVGSWSYSNRHSHILGGVSGEAGAKSDLMVFSPNIPVFAVNGEVGSATELVPNSSAENYYSLVVAEPLDRERVSEYGLTVKAKDQGDPSLSTSNSLVVPISDVNDNAPTFAQPTYTVFVKENNPPGAHIFTVSASDPDVAENSLISYWLDEKLWPLSSYISVNSESGKLYALQPLDYEELKLLEFRVNAKDAGLPSLCGNVTVQVFVVDENDNAPAVSAQAEETLAVLVFPVASGHVVGKVHALDADSGYNAWLRYELHEATSSLWRVGLHSGEISTTRAVDEAEGSSSQHLLVLVKDHGKPPLSATATLSVSLVTSGQALRTDARLPRTGDNSKPQVDNANVNVYLIIAICSVSSLFVLAIALYVALRCHCHEKEAMVYGPGTATLVCASEVGSWSYSNRHSHILAGVSGEAGAKSDLMVFSPNIPASTENGKQLDLLCAMLVVKAEDQGVPSLSSSSSLVVSIGDVNDNAPTFSQPTYTVFVKENNPPGAHIFTVSASDPDMAENALISYGMDEKLWPLSSYISVHSESGKFYALQPLDYEELKLLEFQVSAKDAGLPSLSSNVMVQIFVVDENDNSPRVSGPKETPIVLVVPVMAGQIVSKIHALDADSGYNAWLHYELHEATRGPWQVGLYSGEISTTRDLDEAEGDGVSYSLLVLVKDHGKPMLSTTATLTVSLVVNAQSTHTDAHLSRTGGSSKSLEENTNVYLIIAICSVSSLFLLAIVVYVALQCRCQPKETMMYGPGTATLVCASEVGTWSYSQRHSCNLGGVPGEPGAKNDLMVFSPNIPIFVENGEVRHGKDMTSNASGHENNPPGAHIFTVSASDPDVAENGLITYWLDEKLWPLSSYISVHSESGKLYALQPLDYEELKLLEFQVSARDAGLPSLCGNVTVQVFIVDENDNVPAVSALADDSTTTLVVPLAAGHMVGKIHALDADSGYNAWLRYELHEGSSGPWRVGLYSGEISTTRALDETEGSNSQRLLVLVKDHGKPALSATATLSLSLVAKAQAIKTDSHLSRTGGGPKPLVDNVNVYLIIAICSVSSLFLLVIIFYVALRCKNQAKEAIMYGPGTATLVCASEVGSWSYSNRHSHILAGVSGEANGKNDLMVFSPNIPVFAENGEVRNGKELIPNSSGENYYSLVLAEPLDREQVAEYRLVVTAQDQGASSLSTTSNLVVPISDVNDNAPAFTQPTYTVFVKENNPPGAHIFTVSASDPDVAENGLITYWLDEKLWPLSSYISVHSESGKLYALQPLDYEEMKLLEFQVNAKDAGLPSLCGNVTVQVFVVDENDNVPAVSGLDETPILLMLPVAAGHVVGKIHALDADSGYNAWLRYELHEGSSSPWRVGLYSGEISTARALDETEGSSSQRLLVLVKDHGKPALSATATLSLSLVTNAQAGHADAHLSKMGGSPKPLKDTVNAYLIIAICSVSSLFLLAIVLYVALRCRCQMKEPIVYGPGTATLVCASEVGSWSYSNRHSHILASVNGDAGTKSDLMVFSPNIPLCMENGETGSMKDPGPSSAGQYGLAVMAQDQGDPLLSSSINLVVPISDINDNAPTFAQPTYTVFVKENNPPGAHIFTVSASDPDVAENAQVSYWLDEKQWPLSSYISVHSESGKLYALQPMDYEEMKLLEFQVRAKDAGLPSLCGNVTVQVFVVDENDNAPAVSAPTEDAPTLLVVPVTAGHMLGKIHALDADSGYNAWLCYELLEATSGPWRVGLYSGEISTTRALDEAEGSSSQNLLVLVKDHGKPVLSSTATFSLSLVANAQAIHTDVRLPRLGASPGPLTSNANVYLTIAICSVSSLFLLVIIVYVALRCQCQPKEAMMYGPGTATLVCASEVGSWSYSNRHSHILAGVSGEAGAKNDLMVFSPNIPVFAENGEVQNGKELVPNTSGQVSRRMDFVFFSFLPMYWFVGSLNQYLYAK